MTEHITKTPPLKRKKIDGSTFSNHDGEGHFSIITIDREQHIVSLDVGGYPVTLTCWPENNSKPYQLVKAILVDAVVGAGNGTK